MLLRGLVRLLAVLMLVSMAWAAEAVGTWEGRSESGALIVLHLKTEGAKLTGTASVNGNEQPISDGRVEKDKLTFSIPSLYGNGTVAVTGTLDGDELRLSLEAPVGVTKASLKRQ
jgi:hypothetical protein